MSCINDEIIQKFIDGEATREEVSLVERHRARCLQCDARIEHQKKVAHSIKNAINLIGKENADIPELKIPEVHAIKPHYSLKRKILASVAAACLILMVFIFSIDRGNDNEQQEISVSDWEYNANMPVSQQDLIITVTDTDGSVVEFILD
jgi:predicted anti-sigma-YlaC factor YlaD